MIFNSKDELYLYLGKDYVVNLGNGSQGRCYYDMKNKVCFKILEQFFDDDMDFYVKYDYDEFVKFNYINNNTYIFGNNNILVNGDVVGYTMEYFKGKMLCDINPLLINLDMFCNGISNVYNDNIILSYNGICSYDVLYNVMYNKGMFKIIDTCEYSFSDKDYDSIRKINDNNFNYAVMMFLIDGYFNEFISSYSYLSDMYLNDCVDVRDFITVFRKYLNEYMGRDINRLGYAKGCLNKRKVNINYIRGYR